MRKSRKVVVLIGALAVIAAFAALLGRDREPHYQGRPLHKWVDGLGRSAFNHASVGRTQGGNAPAKLKAAEAVQHIGTNAIPFLLRWISYESQPSKRKQSIARFAFRFPFLQRVGPIRRWLDSGDQLQIRANAAVDAFEVLGPYASPAVPELIRIATTSTDQGAGERAVDALCGIGSVGLPALIGIATTSTNQGPARRAVDALSGIRSVGLPALLCVMTNKHAVARFYAVRSAQRLGTNAISVIPTLILCLKDREVAPAAFEALGRLRIEPQLVVPALADTLRHPDASMRSLALLTLVDYGHQARFALPVIVPALTDSDEDVREYARNALQAIAPEVLTNAAPQ